MSSDLGWKITCARGWRSSETLNLVNGVKLGQTRIWLVINETEIVETPQKDEEKLPEQKPDFSNLKIHSVMANPK